MGRFKSDLIDLEVILHHETKPGEPEEGAIKVSLDGNNAKAEWLPKSQVTFERRKNGEALVTLPENLAFEKGLI